MQIITMERPEGEFSAHLHGTSGPLIVCLHGFPDTEATFSPLIPAFLAAGFRVLTPVMRGYEPGSVQSRRDYYVIQLADDVLAWLDHLDERQVFLLGHDWGAVAGWLAIARASHRFRAYVSLAIPHLGGFLPSVLRHPSQVFLSWYMQFFQLPGMPEKAMARRQGELIRFLWRSWSPDWQAPADVLDPVVARLSQAGTREAALGYYRCLFRPWHAPNRELLLLVGHSPRVPSLALAGAHDGCISAAVFTASMKPVLAPGLVDMEILENAGHFLHWELPEQVARRVLTHFRRW